MKNQDLILDATMRGEECVVCGECYDFRFSVEGDEVCLVGVDIVKGKSEVGASLVVPSMIRCGEQVYRVTDVGNYALSGMGFGEVVFSRGIRSLGDGVCFGCRGLKRIVIPSSIDKIGVRPFWGADAAVMSDSMYYRVEDGCLYSMGDKALVYVPIGVSSMRVMEGTLIIGSDAFDGCSGLVSVDIPTSVRVIQAYGFYCCDGLKDVVLPEGLRELGDYAFGECSRLIKIMIPKSVDKIGIGVFDACYNLRGDGRANWEGV